MFVNGYDFLGSHLPNKYTLVWDSKYYKEQMFLFLPRNSHQSCSSRRVQSPSWTNFEAGTFYLKCWIFLWVELSWISL